MLIQKGAPVGIIYCNSTPPLPQLANPALKPPLNLLFAKQHFSPEHFCSTGNRSVFSQHSC